MLDWTRDLFEPARNIENVHLVVLLTNLIRQAACPCLDLVELMLLFVVPCFANIDFLVFGEIPRTPLGVPGYEHDKAAIYDFTDTMVTILTRLDNFIFEKVFVNPVNRLLRSVIPAGIYPLLAGTVLPRAIDLSHNRFRQVIRVGDMNPVT